MQMKKSISLFLKPLLFLTFFSISLDSAESKNLTTMESVNLSRYLGKWYEIALLPNRFEKKCLEGAIAEYTQLDRDLIQVTNTCCTKKGPAKAKGVAWIVDEKSHAKLKVSFVPFAKFFHWFGGDYWILYVDEDYQMALVGDPSYRYLWLLSRKPHLSDEAYNHLLDIARNKGYDISKVRKVR